MSCRVRECFCDLGCGSQAGLGQVLVVYLLLGWDGVPLDGLCTEWVEYVKDDVFQ